MQTDATISITSADGTELSIMVQPDGGIASVEIVGSDGRARMNVKLNDLRALVIAAQRVLDA